MCTCEFCLTSFCPRPQVKHPRACAKCQAKRQRANEKAWHERNPKYLDKVYHSVKKQQRMKRIRKILEIVYECLRVGKDFLKHRLDLENIRTFLSQFLAHIGIRKINKFWDVSILVGLDATNPMP